jgi:hypothetical protein
VHSLQPVLSKIPQYGHSAVLFLFERVSLCELNLCVQNTQSNSTNAQYVTLQIKFFFNEKSKHAGLGKQNGFGAAFLHSLLRLVKGTAKPNNTS